MQPALARSYFDSRSRTAFCFYRLGIENRVFLALPDNGRSRIRGHRLAQRRSSKPSPQMAVLKRLVVPDPQSSSENAASSVGQRDSCFRGEVANARPDFLSFSCRLAISFAPSPGFSQPASFTAPPSAVLRFCAVASACFEPFREYRPAKPNHLRFFSCGFVHNRFGPCARLASASGAWRRPFF